MKKIYLILSVFLFSVGIQAQNMTVTGQNQSFSRHQLTGIRTITFTNGNLRVNNTNGTSASYSLTNVRNILFKGEINTAVSTLSSANTVSLFPNPVQTELTIRFSEVPANKVQLSIYSIDGKLAHTETLPELSSNEYQLNVATLQPGMYILRMINGQEIQTNRFVKK